MEALLLLFVYQEASCLSGDWVRCPYGHLIRGLPNSSIQTLHEYL